MPEITAQTKLQESALTPAQKQKRAERSKAPMQSTSELIARLTDVLKNMREFALSHQGQLADIDHRFARSAANLLEYLALRRHDLREVQMRLSRLGLSSLGRSEAHAQATVVAVLRALHALAGLPPFHPGAQSLGFEQGDRLLERHTAALLGPSPEGRQTRIMVTMPSEAATDYKLVRDLVQSGMNVMRINCAHDSQPQWQRMIKNLRKACKSGAKRCLVLMDLAGPKLRTGAIEPGETAFKLSPQRDLLGHMVAPARLLLVSQRPTGTLPSCDAQILVPHELLAGVKPGGRIRITDTRGRIRSPACVQGGRGWRLLELRKSCYIDNGVKLRVPGGRKFKLAGLAPRPGELLVRTGDLVALTADSRAGRMSTRFLDGEDRPVAVVPCSLPEVIGQVKFGEPVWFDDGKVGGVVILADAVELLIEVTHAKDNGSKIAADKGINLPQSELRLDALTHKDREDLPFVASHADLLGLSFANRPEDVAALQAELGARTGARPGIVLKIETKRGFANLATMLLAAMRSYPAGVMIARGDLAVECGFERLAEVQEEILWICEAAHVPVIWATQVLETLAKKGAPTRAEITDAAMAERAECVMLNKGPHVVKAVRTLDDILRRMQGHQSKKRAMLRELSIASNNWTQEVRQPATK